MRKLNGIIIGRNFNRKIEALVASLGGKRPKGGLEVRALAWAEKRVMEMTKSGELYLHPNWQKIVRCLLKAQEMYIEYCKYSYYAEDDEVEREWWDSEWDAAIQWQSHVVDLFCGR